MFISLLTLFYLYLLFGMYCLFIAFSWERLTHHCDKLDKQTDQIGAGVPLRMDHNRHRITFCALIVKLLTLHSFSLSLPLPLTTSLLLSTPPSHPHSGTLIYNPVLANTHTHTNEHTDTEEHTYTRN